MARRVGIELSPSRCALVDLDVRAGGAPPAQVRTFRTIPWSPHTAGAFAATLRLLRQSNVVPARAAVALWGLDATCHHFSLPSGDDQRLRAQALREVRMTAPVADRSAVHAVLVDHVATSARRTTRDVTVVTAPAAQVQALVAPLVSANFAIEAVITPAMALASLARLLPDGDDTVRAYVAVNADATAVAIVRNGLLLLAREVALPCRASCGSPDADAGTGSGDVLDFVRRLAPELKRSFLLLKQQSKLDVRQVVICGEFRDLRALTAPLMTSLQVEVATLDGPQGLAAGAALDAEVRDQAGALRVAWAAGAAGSRLASLLPAAAASADWRRPVVRLAPRVAAALVLLAAVSFVGWAAWMRPAGPRNAARGEARGLELDARPATNAAAERAAVGAGVAGSTRVSPPPDAPAFRVRQPRLRRPRVAAASAEPAVPDPIVDSILYGPDRRLALIGHRIVRVGDRVDAGVIEAIEPKAVLVRRPSGELRRVQLKTR